MPHVPAESNGGIVVLKIIAYNDFPVEKVIFWDWSGTLAEESKLDKAVCQSIEQEISRQKKLPLHDAASIFIAYLKQLENTWEWHDYVRH